MDYHPFIFSIATFFSTVSGGLIVTKYRKFFGAIQAFAGSGLIAISLLDLLPESLQLATENQVSFATVMYITVAGFFFLLVLERYISISRVMSEGEYHNERRARGGWIAAGELIVHSFIEGIAIGLSFKLELNLGIAVAIAIIGHDFCDGINVMTVMLNSKNTLKASTWMLILDSAAPLLGVASTLLFTVPDKYLLFLISFLVGGFLFLGASDCLPESFEKFRPWVTVVSCTVGFLLISVIVKLSGI